MTVRILVSLSRHSLTCQFSIDSGMFLSSSEERYLNGCRCHGELRSILLGRVISAPSDAAVSAFITFFPADLVHQPSFKYDNYN